MAVIKNQILPEALLQGHLFLKRVLLTAMFWKLISNAAGRLPVLSITITDPGVQNIAKNAKIMKKTGAFESTPYLVTMLPKSSPDFLIAVSLLADGGVKESISLNNLISSLSTLKL